MNYEFSSDGKQSCMFIIQVGLHLDGTRRAESTAMPPPAVTLRPWPLTLWPQNLISTSMKQIHM